MIKGILVFSIITLVILSTFALAAGSSSGGSPSNKTRDSVNKSVAIKTCEDKDGVSDRIKCRFENKGIAEKESDGVEEEACRDRDGVKKEACKQLYKRSAHCYNATGDAITKKRCFLKESGIELNKGGTFRAAPDGTKRNYVILLLYDLQERIEAMQESGKITVEQATSLVTKIVEIKRLILSEAKRSDIVPKIQEFKKEYRSVISSVKNNNQRGTNVTNVTNST